MTWFKRSMVVGALAASMAFSGCTPPGNAAASRASGSVALLNDDSTEVGRVHIGVVHVFECETDAVACGEAVITELAFHEQEALRLEREQMETWSQICMDQLHLLLGRP